MLSVLVLVLALEIMEKKTRLLRLSINYGPRP